MTSCHYWLRRGRILWWMKMEVSPVICGYSSAHYFPVGRIVCSEDRNLVQSDTPPPHLPTPVPPGHPTLDSPSLVDPDAPAWKRLINRTFSSHEFISLIEAMSTSEDELKIIRDLHGDDAQAFVDAVQEVRSILLFAPCDLIIPHPLRVLHLRTFTSAD